jgi:hypothetical protein
MVATFRNIARTGDLHPLVQQAMAKGASHPLKTPVITMSISVHKLTFTVQEDGQIAIFNPDRLIACECQGHFVFDIPEPAKLIVGFTYGDVHIHIYQDGEQFYSARGNRATALKIYQPTAYDKNDDRNMVEQNDGEECVIYHTNDDSLDDYYKIEDDAGDHSPIPRHGQPDQVENDPKEGK